MSSYHKALIYIYIYLYLCDSGRPVDVTWTQLASTANVGDTALTLTTPVTWEPGTEIVIATTGGHLSQSETETAFVTAVSADGTVVDLDSPLEVRCEIENSMLILNTD